MVESGTGLAVLPETAARRFQRSMAICVIPLTDNWALRHHAVCIRDFKSLPAHAQRLVECLKPASRHASILPGGSGITMAPIGTLRTSRYVRYSAACGDKADMSHRMQASTIYEHALGSSVRNWAIIRVMRRAASKDASA
jgi:hypothetical protein